MSSAEAGVLVAALLLGGAVHAHPRVSTDVTFDRDVIRVVRARCLPCHGDGGAAVPLTSYATARPYARAIRDQVLARRMPPWPPHPAVGDFADDGSLSAHAAALLVAWADGGAPEGDAADLPTDPPPPSPERLRPVDGAQLVVVQASASPKGRLVGLRPLAARGANIEVDLVRAGAAQPLLWIRRFDPTYPYVYRLRDPVELARGDRVVVRGGRVELNLLPPSSPPAP